MHERGEKGVTEGLEEVLSLYDNETLKIDYVLGMLPHIQVRVKKYFLGTQNYFLTFSSLRIVSQKARESPLLLLLLYLHALGMFVVCITQMPISRLR